MDLLNWLLADSSPAKSGIRAMRLENRLLYNAAPIDPQLLAAMTNGAAQGTADGATASVSSHDVASALHADGDTSSVACLLLDSTHDTSVATLSPTDDNGSHAAPLIDDPTHHPSHQSDANPDSSSGHTQDTNHLLDGSPPLLDTEPKVETSPSPTAPTSETSLLSTDGWQVASAADTTAPVADHSAIEAPAASTDTNDSGIVVDSWAQACASPIPTDAPTSTHTLHELVLINSDVSNYDQLLHDLQAQQPGREFDVVILDSHREGIAQVTAALEHGTYDGVHILAHATEQAVKLGSDWISADKLDPYCGEIASWGMHLSSNADLLFYGCNLAAHEEGRTLLDAFAHLTGADVAASVDNTGHAALGGDWDLEYHIGDIETSVALSSTVQQDWHELLAASTGGYAIFTNSADTSPNYSHWDGLTFGAAGSSASVGDWQIIQGADAPTRQEQIVLGVDAAGTLSGLIGDGSGSALSFNNLATGLDPNSWGFDVAYESQSGDALVVWNNGTTGSTSISFRVWDGSSWSAEQTISAPVSGGATQLQLAASASSDQMALIVSNSNHDEYALIWDGSSWGNSVTLSTGSVDDRTEIAVAFESLSNEVLVVYDGVTSGSGLHYRNWDGSSWSSELTLSPPAGADSAGDAAYTAIASDPNSNRIALAVVTEGGDSNEVWFAVWDGNSWGNQNLASSAGVSTAGLNAAVGFESNSGDLLAVYAEAANAVRYRTWSSGSGWSAELTGPDIAANPNSMTLSSDPAHNAVMLSVQDSANDLHFVEWNGSAWGSETELSTNTGLTGSQPFVYLYNQNSSSPQATLWLSTSGNSASPGVTGVNSLSDGGAVEFGDPNLSLEPGTTSGTFSNLFDLDNFAVDGNANLDAIDYVTHDLLVGSGANTVQLLAGDVLLSTGASETLSSNNSLAVTKDEVVIFRPDTPGDYSTGTFIMLLDNFSTISGGNDTWSLALVEQDTLVGDTILTAGSFLFSREGAAQDNDIYWFQPTGVGAGVTAGTASVLIEGDDLGIAPKVHGLELVCSTVTIGGVTLTAGQILVDLDANDATVGSNSISVTEHDVFILDVSQTTLGSGTAVANATLLFQGADVGLSGAAESLDALAIYDPGSAPVVTPSGATASYTEDASPVLIDPTATLGDADSSNFNGGELTIDFVSGGDANDRLTIWNEGTGAGEIGVSGTTITYGGVAIGTYSGGTGSNDPLIISFNGNSTPTSAEAVLQHVQFETLGDDPSTALRTVRFSMNDGDGLTSTPTTADISVAAVNDAPVNSVPAAQTLLEDGSLVFSSAGGNAITVSDADAGASLMQISLSATNGTLTLATTSGLTFLTGDGTADASLQFTGTLTAVNAALDGMSFAPTANFSGGAGIGLVASDQGATGSGGAQSDVDGIGITVTAVNDPPAIDFPGPTLNFTENGGPTVVDATATVSDVDSSDFSGGQLQIGFSANGQSEDRLSIQNQGIGAGQIGVSGANVTYGGVTIGSFSGGQDGSTPLVITFNANSTPTAVQALARAITYDNISESPSPLTRTWQATLTDGDGGTSSTISGDIAVTAQNDIPVAVADSGSLSENGTLIVPAASGVLSNDTDADTSDVLSVSAVEGQGAAVGNALVLPSGATVTVQADGSYVYNPGSTFDWLGAGESTTDSFTYTVSDGHGGTSTAAVTLTINGANDSPSATNATLVLSENTANGTLVHTLAATDPDTSDTLSYSILGGNTGGAFAIDANTGAITVANSAVLDYESLTSITLSVQVRDTSGATSTANVTINLTDVNDNAPVIGSSQTFSVAESASNGAAVGVATATDADTVGSLQGWQIVGGNTDGIFTINASTGAITIGNSTNLNYEATNLYQLQLIVSDGVNTSAVTTVTIDITDVNEAPVLIANSLTISEGGTVVLSGADLQASDQDNTSAQLTYAVTSVAGGQFELVSNAGVAISSFTQAQLDAGQIQFVHDGNEAAPTYSLQVSDGSLTDGPQGATISFNNVNDPPVANGESYTLAEDGNLVISPGSGVLTNDTDIEGDPLSAVLVSGPAHGTLTLQPDGSFHYTPNADYFGADSFQYQANDAQADSNVVTVTITVTPVNDAPVAADDSFTTGNTNNLVVDAPGVLGNDIDVDSASLTTELLSVPSHGSITMAGDGSFRYVPDPNFSGTVSFTYRISDGTDYSNVVTVTIVVRATGGPGGNTGGNSGSGDSDSDSNNGGSNDPHLPAGAPPPEIGERPRERPHHRPPHSSSDDGSGMGPAGPSIGIDFTLSNSGEATLAWEKLAGGGWRQGTLHRLQQHASAGISSFTETYQFNVATLYRKLTNMLDESAREQSFQQYMAGVAATITTTLTAGYILWALRGTYLIASVAATLPSWATFDPLPLLEEERDREQDASGQQQHGKSRESLADLVHQGSQAGSAR